MTDPVQIDPPQRMSAEDQIKIANARHLRNMQTAFLTVLGILALSLFVPLGVWLTRLAMGG